MSKRNRREHGRILSVETKNRGDSLADDFAAGVTSITVNDAGDFDEDGGWLYIGAQTVEYIECDDDTGVVTLADPLAAAAEQGDPVSLWSDLYGEVVDYQLALVELDGEYDNPDPVAAEVAEGVGELPEGDRGKAGESCTLHRVAEDEWEVVAVGGRSAKSKGLRAEADDYYVLTAADITAGSATIPLSHRPADEWLIAVLAGVPQRPTNYSINYDAQTITWPLDGWEPEGAVIWVHYAYRKGVATTTITEPAHTTLFHWTLDETSGTTWADSGPNAAGMTIFGTPTLGQAPAPGFTGYSATFNGTNAAGRTAAGTSTVITAALDQVSEISWGFSVKSSKTTGYQGIVTRQMLNHTAGSADVHWSIGIVNGNLQMQLFYDDGTSVTLNSPSSIANGAWHRCWLALGGGTLTMYVDGTKVAEAAWTHPTRGGYGKSVVLGAYSLYQDPDTNWLQGSMDDVLIVAGKVTESEAGSL